MVESHPKIHLDYPFFIFIFAIATVRSAQVNKKLQLKVCRSSDQPLIGATECSYMHTNQGKYPTLLLVFLNVYFKIKPISNAWHAYIPRPLFIIHMELNICRALPALRCGCHLKKKIKIGFISVRIFNYIYIPFQCFYFPDYISNICQTLGISLAHAGKKDCLFGGEKKSKLLHHFSAGVAQDTLYYEAFLLFVFSLTGSFICLGLFSSEGLLEIPKGHFTN